MKYTEDPRFCAVYPFVLQLEGGFVDNPKDSGGPTMHGIAWNYNQASLLKLGITRSTMRKLTKEQALQIYFDRYWLGSKASEIKDEGLSFLHFDTAVNNGPGVARQILSELSVDPFIYDGTGDLNECLFLRLVLEYGALRLFHYTHDNGRVSKQEFLEGWVNRMVAVLQRAGKLV